MDMQEIVGNAFIIRRELLDKNEYTLENVKYLLELQEVEDDGLESERTQSLRVLVDILNGTV